MIHVTRCIYEPSVREKYRVDVAHFPPWGCKLTGAVMPGNGEDFPPIEFTRALKLQGNQGILAAIEHVQDRQLWMSLNTALSKATEHVSVLQQSPCARVAQPAGLDGRVP